MVGTLKDHTPAFAESVCVVCAWSEKYRAVGALAPSCGYLASLVEFSRRQRGRRIVRVLLGGWLGLRKLCCKRVKGVEPLTEKPGDKLPYTPAYGSFVALLACFISVLSVSVYFALRSHDDHDSRSDGSRGSWLVARVDYDQPLAPRI